MPFCHVYKNTMQNTWYYIQIQLPKNARITNLVYDLYDQLLTVYSKLYVGHFTTDPTPVVPLVDHKWQYPASNVGYIIRNDNTSCNQLISDGKLTWKLRQEYGFDNLILSLTIWYEVE